MKRLATKATSIDEYIDGFPVDIRKKLKDLRTIIRAAAPTATEKISYSMPAFAQNGILVYFAGYESHIGFYPTASGIAAFKSRLAKYKTSKGTVQFPLDKPLPVGLIKAIVKHRVAMDQAKSKK
jgi:uncharacterized protein YdhG (YjbR/CyaY superfamily)